MEDTIVANFEKNKLLQALLLLGHKLQVPVHAMQEKGLKNAAMKELEESCST